jgi:hypothetical protein
MQEMQEFLDAHKTTSRMTYCSIPQWQRLIETAMSCGNDIQVRAVGEETDYECITMRMLGIWEAPEATMIGVSHRDIGPTDFLA